MIPPSEIPQSLLGETPDAVLLPYQQKWIADQSGFKMFTKSRRIGVTWADAAGAALLAAQARGRNTFYLGYERDMARDYISTVGEWGKVYALACSEVEESEEVFRDGDDTKSINVFRVYFDSGYRVEALSSTPRNLRGKQGDVVIDEAAFHDELGEVLKAAKALRLWGGRVRLITTYDSVDNEYYDLEKEVLAGRYPYSRHFTTFLGAIEQGLFRRICLMTGRTWSAEAEKEFIAQTLEEFGEDADEELLCIPNRSSGRYFSLDAIERAMQVDTPILTYACKDGFAIKPEAERVATTQTWLEEELEPVLRMRLDANLKSYYGMDFGRSGDLSVILPVQELPDLTRAAVLGLELRNVPFEQQRQILFFLVDRLPRFMAGANDARGNGQYLAEVAMQRYGPTRIHQVALSRPWYGENFPKYKAGLEEGRVHLPASSDWKDDHRAVEVDKGIPLVPDKKTKGSDGKQRHGDAAIAGVLAWFASLNGGAPIEYESVGEPRLAYKLDDYLLEV